MKLNLLLSGQKYFGCEVLRSLLNTDFSNVVCVSSPLNTSDSLTDLAIGRGIEVIPSGTLNAYTMPNNIDLIVAAHSHDFIGEKTRLKARYGAIGYHPSLLPLHRGRDAIRWAIRMNDKVTGGSVYRLSNKMDGGNIILQDHVFIEKNETPKDLWRHKLAPLGVKLLVDAVKLFAEHGFQNGIKQNESIATWEPSIDRQPMFRPDLVLIPSVLIDHEDYQ